MKVYAQETIPYTQEYFLRKEPVFQHAVVWMLSALIVVIFIFISCAPFEEVVKVTGTIRPEENISAVTNAVTGRIKSVSYESAQRVKKGNLLLEIDPTQLEAERQGLLSLIDSEDERLQSLHQTRESITAGINKIDRTAHYEAWLRYEAWRTNLSKLANMRNLCHEKYLQEKNIPSSMTTLSKMQELESEYLVSCRNYDDCDISFRHQVESEINSLETSYKTNVAKLSQIEDSLRFTKVLAPIDGIIQEISVFNEGDWIQAGQKLFNLIPDDETLTKVELSIPAKQAGKIEAGMKVKMRFPSLPYNEFGGTEGTIVTIDPDITKSQNGEAYFLIKANLESQSLTDKKGKEYPLKVGLQVDARIILSDRTILQYILEKMHLWW
ncbi:MAG: HlyD family efflux transporter periplasmic adaptor subunit [Treponema sp.]|nr:HlyD family efflux transporter periplasmic adaptor subunit [Treponema sp.]